MHRKSRYRYSATEEAILFLMAFIEMEGADRLVEWWNADHGKE